MSKERISGRLDVSRIKRMQMPDTTILIPCPKCGDVLHILLVDHIYYPGEEHSVAFECEECDIEIQRKIDIISVIVTLDVHDPEVV